MDKFRNGYIAGFVSATACILLAMSWTLPSGDINNYAGKEVVTSE